MESYRHNHLTHVLNHASSSDLSLPTAQDRRDASQHPRQLGLGPPAPGKELPGARFGVPGARFGVPRHRDKDATTVKRRFKQGQFWWYKTRDKETSPQSILGTLWYPLIL